MSSNSLMGCAPYLRFQICCPRLLNPLVTPPVFPYKVREYLSSFFLATLIVVLLGYNSPWQGLED